MPKYVTAEEFYRRVWFVNTFHDTDADTYKPQESGWGAPLDPAECDVVYSFDELDGSPSGVIAHEDYALLYVDWDFAKQDEYDTDDVSTSMDRQPFVVETRTDGNIHTPVLVDLSGVDDDSVVYSRYPWIDVIGDAAHRWPTWAASPVDTPGYDEFYEETPIDEQYVPVIQPSELAKIWELDGEPVARWGEPNQQAAESVEEISADLPIDMRDILPGVKPGRNISHPIHGSETGGNFGIDIGADTWYCFSARHDHVGGNVTGNAYHYVAMQEGILECGDWMGGEPWAGKREKIAEACRERDIPLPPSWRDDRTSADWRAVERTERIGFDADDSPEIEILHGSPRYDHKTTQLFEDHAGRDVETTYSVVPNHELGSEQTVDHLGPGEFGIDARRVVHLKGQQRACPSNCVHHRTGELNHGKHVHAAARALERHDVVTPQVFVGQDEICPHFATILAAESARWVILPPEMLKHVDPPDSYSVIIDEETTINRLRPKDPGVLTFQENRTDDTPANFVSTGRPLTHDAVQAVREKVQDEIDELDRVPKRYRNVEQAIDALETLNDRLDACGLGFATDADDAIQCVEGIDVPNVDLTGSTAEREAALSYVREGLRSFGASKYLEAIIAGASLHVVQSGAKYNAKLVPDLTADLLFHREFFANANNLGVVGNQVGSWFAWQLGVDDPDVTTMDGLTEIEKSRLDIVLVSGDEQERRRTMDEAAAELTTSGIENLLVTGSKDRARNAVDRLPAESYHASVGTSSAAIEELLRGTEGWNVTTYMNGAVTRGIDLPIQATIARTSQFDASVWDAQPEFSPIAKYVRATETINAMLRGAGQGERHVAVAPDDIEPFLDWGLADCATELSEVDEIVDLVLDALTDVERDSDSGMFRCSDCGMHFLERDQFLDHACSPAPMAAD